MRSLLFTLVLAMARGQFLNTPADPVDAATLKAMFEVACGGEIVKGRCQANPIDGGTGSWTLDAVRFGHFLSPTSEDAIVTTSGFEPLDWFPVGSNLMSKRSGKWEGLGIYKVHLDVRACRKVGMADRRDMLICQTHSRSVETNYSIVLAVSASFDDLQEKELFVASDSTQRCEPSEPGDRIQKTTVDNITLNAAHLTVAAHYGELMYTAALKRACRERHFPDPPMKAYALDYVFDGRAWKASAQSAAAAKLFQ